MIPLPRTRTFGPKGLIDALPSMSRVGIREYEREQN